MASRHVIAIDLGAESGRVMRVHFDGNKLEPEEVHRFPNVPVMVHNTLYWDALRLWHEISTGVEAAAPDAAAIGVDTWGVDFALLDKDGRLLSNPIHYRDRSSEGMEEWVCQRVPRREIFERTGIQFMAVNGLWRLAYLAKQTSPVLTSAATFLTIPDLFNFWLSGSLTCEFTHATTQQFFNPRLNDWDRATLSQIGVPMEIFPPVVQPGTRLGNYNGVPVIAPATHDTGSAVVAVPTTTENYAYLSSGTWSLLGLELRAPIINDAVYQANLTNEGGVNGTFRLLKNIAGMWLVQQSRSIWQQQGHKFDYADLAALAEQAEPFRSLIDPDDALFFAPGDMPARIREFCQRSGQPIPESVGQVTRTIYEGLALKYRHALALLERVSRHQVDRLHIIGGGSRNALLCQMAANAIGRPVIAGPTEATALGNAVVQFIALGEFGSLAQARELMSRTMLTQTYTPRETSQWDEVYEGRYQALLAGM